MISNITTFLLLVNNYIHLREKLTVSLSVYVTRVAAYLKGRFDKALVTAHTWLVTSGQPSRKTSEIFLQSCRCTRTWREMGSVSKKPLSSVLEFD